MLARNLIHTYTLKLTNNDLLHVFRYMYRPLLNVMISIICHFMLTDVWILAKVSWWVSIVGVYSSCIDPSALTFYVAMYFMACRVNIT